MVQKLLITLYKTYTYLNTAYNIYISISNYFWIKNIFSILFLILYEWKRIYKP